jgi:hypothetical protein
VADFRTHLIGGSIVCAVASLGSYSQGLSSALETQGLFALGTAASLLPDIDADDSRPLRTVFDVAGIFVGFLVAFRFAGTSSRWSWLGSGPVPGSWCVGPCGSSSLDSRYTGASGTRC